MSISFHAENITSPKINKAKLVKWLSLIIKSENKKVEEISIIFTSDEYLLKINQEHLSHDFYTDVITFDYSHDNKIAGDIFISIERVEENAKTYNVEFSNELNRIMAHGVLHLCGYKDKETNEKLQMTSYEDKYLLLFDTVE